MTKYNKLRLKALESCKFRGHIMSRFSHHEFVTASGAEKWWVADARCHVCGAICCIDTNPLPNSITISGGAVAVHCTKG